LAVPASGSTFLHMSRAELAAKASSVVLGNVLSVESFWTKSGRIIVTEAMVEVEDAVLGEAPSVVRVRTFGGTVNGYTVEAHGFPTFEKGERLLLFLEQDKADPDATRVLGYQEGMYRVAMDKAGREVAHPTVDAGARLLTADGKVAPVQRPVLLDDLRGEVRELGRRAGRLVN
ncbi:MAG TPA: hypothetical protein VN811_04605, partial [Thermoanaerobaculia bacterium]|nr:hypothetical protein [Thermoanaerobaculia bacterium]